MAISVARAKAHIEEWTAKLPSRPRWPNHLFFAAHVTSAAKIIESGRLRCRRDLGGLISHDVAHPDAVGTNPAAHNYVRLYFRPKTYFHLRTEGIKLLSDNYRLPAHMSVPIMFLFDFTSVATRPGVKFCERKMAHVGITPGCDEAYFDNIDFSKVYHDSGIGDPARRQDINDRRMAEVLVPNELPLDGTLNMIVARTQFDAMTLDYQLRSHSPNWRSKLRVATKPAEVFFCWGTYITELQLRGDALTMKVKPSHDFVQGKKLKFDIKQYIQGPRGKRWQHDYALTKNPLLITGWDPAPNNDWVIEIEDALAFHAKVPIAQSTVVGK